MSNKYMWWERVLELDSLSDALTTAVEVLAVECKKHVSTILAGFLKIWNVYAATYKTLFWDFIGTPLKAK